MRQLSLVQSLILRSLVSVIALCVGSGCIPRKPTRAANQPALTQTPNLPPTPLPDPPPIPNGSLALTLSDPGSASAPARQIFTLPVPSGKTAMSVTVDLKIPASLPFTEVSAGWVDGRTGTTTTAIPGDGAWHSYAAKDLRATRGGVGFVLGSAAGTTLTNAKLNLDNFIVTYLDGTMDCLRFDAGSNTSVLTTASDSDSARITTALDSSDGSNPVTLHGALKVVGNQIQDQYGRQVQLKGMSLFWSQWASPFWNAQLVHHLADDWNVGVIRAAMAVEKKDGGFLANPVQKTHLEKVVAAALADGIYVIIDWHYTGNRLYTQEAGAFFAEMASTWGAKPNVIFEIYNEPLDTNNWPELKSYSETVTHVIRAAGSQNLVLLPSPRWDQQLELPAADPLDPTNFRNVAYTLHFYAGTHKKDLRDVADAAMARGLPIFVSEWGVSDCTGGSNHQVYLDESRAWIDWMDLHQLSSCNWSMFDKNESSCALLPGASKTGPWPDKELSASGKFVRGYINGSLAGPAH